MTLIEIEAELEVVRTDINRLRAREASLEVERSHAVAEEARAQRRPGWPIRRRAQASGRKISTSSNSRIAV